MAAKTSRDSLTGAMMGSKGFSLIELMVVLGVIGILAAFVIPSYAEYVQRSKISEAVNTLSEMRTRMERYFQDNRTYQGACSATTVAPLPSPTPGGFSFSCPVLQSNSFEIIATGSNVLAGLVYSINEVNVRCTKSVPAGWVNTSGPDCDTDPALTRCWIRTEGGGC